MMTCREASDLHTNAAEGALSGGKKALYKLHMAICGHCRRYRAQLVTTAGVLRGLPKEPPPPEDLVDLLANELEKKKM